MRRPWLFITAALVLATQLTGQVNHKARPVPNTGIQGKVIGVQVVSRVPIPPPATCPVTVTSQVTIVVDGPATVTYHWVYSDHTTGPDQTLTFSKASGMMVTSSYVYPYLGQGWVYVETVSPNPIQSRPAMFIAKCGPQQSQD